MSDSTELDAPSALTAPIAITMGEPSGVGGEILIKAILVYIVGMWLAKVIRGIVEETGCFTGYERNFMTPVFESAVVERREP